MSYQCPMCKEVKGEEEIVHRDGVMMSICKVCAETPVKDEVVNAKRCGMCKRMLDLEQFPNDKTRGDGKYPRCKECVSTAYRARKTAPKGRLVPLEATEAKIGGTGHLDQQNDL